MILEIFYYFLDKVIFLEKICKYFFKKRLGYSFFLENTIKKKLKITILLKKI